jgi:hypothetical protein
MWMLLLVDTDQNAKTGWMGYDYVINHEVTNDTATTVKQWRGGAWRTTGEVAYRVNDNELELSVSRKLLGESDGDPDFDFHWADNIQSFEGVAELGLNGDSAPNRRWNYRFRVAR